MCWYVALHQLGLRKPFVTYATSERSIQNLDHLDSDHLRTFFLPPTFWVTQLWAWYPAREARLTQHILNIGNLNFGSFQTKSTCTRTFWIFQLVQESGKYECDTWSRFIVMLNTFLCTFTTWSRNVRSVGVLDIFTISFSISQSPERTVHASQEWRWKRGLVGSFCLQFLKWRYLSQPRR